MAKLLKFDPEGNPVVSTETDIALLSKVEKIKEGNSFKRVFLVMDDQKVPPIGNQKLSKDCSRGDDNPNEIIELTQYL